MCHRVTYFSVILPITPLRGQVSLEPITGRLEKDASSESSGDEVDQPSPPQAESLQDL